MKKTLTILILLLASCQSFSQIVKFDSISAIPFNSGVAMPLETYRYIRTKTINCDTLIKVNEEILSQKDTIIINLESQLSMLQSKGKSYEIELQSKGKTIFKLDSIAKVQDTEMDKMEYKTPFYKRKTTYYAFLVGFIIPLLLK